MEQLKPYLKLLQKHHFWVICALAVITAIVVWKTATASIDEETSKNRSLVEGKFQAVKSIELSPPNETFKTAVNSRAEELKQRVFQAWQALYERQVGLFRWPEVVRDIERLPETQEIPISWRERYNNLVVESEWRRVFEVLDVVRPKPVDPDASEEERQAEEYIGTVVWDESARRALVDRYRSSTRPSSVKVRITQEDLWIFESLFRMIRGLNAQAADSSDAVVKRIDTLDIGRYAMADAMRDPGKIDVLAAGKTATQGVGAGSMGNQIPTAGAADSDLLSYRYLDAQGKPLEASGNKVNHPFAAFKQMFVRMKLVVNQNNIPDVLAACANNDLPIEVKQVRLWFYGASNMPTSGGGTSSGAGGGVSAPGSMAGPGSMPGSMAGAGAMGPGGMPGAMAGPGAMGPGAVPGAMAGPSGSAMAGGSSGVTSSAAGTRGPTLGEMTPDDCLVEIRGIIYLYNPPDLAKLDPQSIVVHERSFGLAFGGSLGVGAGAGGGSAGGMPGAMPGGMQGAMPGGMQGAMPGGMPGAMPGGS